MLYLTATICQGIADGKFMNSLGILGSLNFYNNSSKLFLSISNFRSGNCRRQMRYDRYEKSALCHWILLANSQISSAKSQIPSENIDRRYCIVRVLRTCIRKFLFENAIRYIRKILCSESLNSSAKSQIQSANDDRRIFMKIVLKTCSIYLQFFVGKSLSANVIPWIRQILCSVSLDSVGKSNNSVGKIANSVGKYRSVDIYEDSAALCHWVQSAILHFASANLQILSAYNDRQICMTILLKTGSIFLSGYHCRQMRYHGYGKSRPQCHWILSANSEILSAKLQIQSANIDQGIFTTIVLKYV